MRKIALFVILMISGQIFAAKKPFCLGSVSDVLLGFKHDNHPTVIVGSNGLAQIKDERLSPNLLDILVGRNDDLVDIYHLDYFGEILNEAKVIRSVNWKNLKPPTNIAHSRNVPILFHHHTTELSSSSFYITGTSSQMAGTESTLCLVKLVFTDARKLRKVINSISQSLVKRGENNNAPGLTLTSKFEQLSFEITLDMSLAVNRNYLNYLLLKFAKINT